MRARVKKSAPVGGSRQRLVRYLGASGFRRFTPKRAGTVSGSAKLWILLLALVTVLLALLGAWQESRTSATRLAVPSSPFDIPLK